MLFRLDLKDNRNIEIEINIKGDYSNDVIEWELWSQA